MAGVGVYPMLELMGIQFLQFEGHCFITSTVVREEGEGSAEK